MSKDRDYRLGRDYLLGLSLHPQIPLDDPNLKIADVGTGTGLFLFDLALDLPESIQLDGFDLSGDQFPVPDYLPKNVRLYQQDTSEEPPQHLQGQYDIVHLRLFVSIILGGNPEPVINHCFKLLKSGGYLQWDEHNPHEYMIKSHNGSSTEGIQKFVEQILEVMTKNGRPMDWIGKLPQFFKSGGFDVITKEAQHEPPWQRRMNMENFCVLTEEFAANFWDKFGPPGSGDEQRQVAVKMNDEVKLGSYISQPFIVVVGRKKST